jgi:hypothetical protein
MLQPLSARTPPGSHPFHFWALAQKLLPGNVLKGRLCAFIWFSVAHSELQVMTQASYHHFIQFLKRGISERCFHRHLFSNEEHFTNRKVQPGASYAEPLRRC